MVTPDDARASFHAMLNQIPPTMAATQAALLTASTLKSVKGEDGEVSLEKLTKLVNQLAATVTVCVVELDNRIERLEGRPGISSDMLEAMLTEFGLGGR
jgi:hypothetical protein